MRSKMQIGKGLKVVLIISVVGVGSYTCIPNVSAASNGSENIAAVKGDQNTSPNELSQLQIAGVQLDQLFDSKVTNYTATVENDVSTIHLLLESKNENSIITVNGKVVESGAPLSFSINTGQNSVLINVDDGIDAPILYNLTINKKQSENNLLQTIKLSNGKLSKPFDSLVTDYNVQVTNKIDSITVTPEADDKFASIMVNDSLLKSEGLAVKIPIGKSHISVKVTAENGETRIYTLNVIREANKSDNIPAKNPTTTEWTNSGGVSNNKKLPVLQTFQRKNTSFTQKTQVKQSQAQLTSLTVSNGAWNKTFTRDEYTYHIALTSEVENITINAIPSNIGATVSIEDNSNKTIQLGANAKKTIISVVVSKDEDDRKTYVLVFDKDVKEQKESVATTTATDPTSTSTIGTNTANSKATVNTFVQNGNRKSNSTSWWARFVSSISDFFKR
jgi:hypothetical protein